MTQIVISPSFFQNNGCPEPITAEPRDTVENVKGNRNICGIGDGLAQLFLHPGS